MLDGCIDLRQLPAELRSEVRSRPPTLIPGLGVVVGREVYPEAFALRIVLASRFVDPGAVVDAAAAFTVVPLCNKPVVSRVVVRDFLIKLGFSLGIYLRVVLTIILKKLLVQGEVIQRRAVFRIGSHDCGFVHERKDLIDDVGSDSPMSHGRTKRCRWHIHNVGDFAGDRGACSK